MAHSSSSLDSSWDTLGDTEPRARRTETRDASTQVTAEQLDEVPFDLVVFFTGIAFFLLVIVMVVAVGIIAELEENEGKLAPETGARLGPRHPIGQWFCKTEL
ncbi:hypothetical protein BU25DRAFT_420293 [Macroventuria anomochaeta]|uniref:Uncharacterized protein n=1 Tax=Macroventuria anomochaeta TaxID=301207 RepID=A0ACB6S7B5_9PLEO|nr:uncharacterized protein BU25DRAFT_420293 [Macroventuria anomochaeta]KAF2629455.1 hypothetical protein BU25DRAFT_420293 [Macroventuria anomochaeta]